MHLVALPVLGHPFDEIVLIVVEGVDPASDVDLRTIVRAVARVEERTIV